MKPILFNTAMVQAILDGKKITTRRIIKVDNKLDFIGCSSEDGCEFNRAAFGKGSFDKLLDAEIKQRIKAPYMPGDILYVRETWLKADDGKYYFRANETPVSREAREDFSYKWHPSLHMPKVAARIFLKVRNVRVERLQDITEQGIRAEGIIEEWPPYARDKFQDLWDSTTKEYRWGLNPWVWAIEFEMCDKPNE